MSWSVCVWHSSSLRYKFEESVFAKCWIQYGSQGVTTHVQRQVQSSWAPLLHRLFPVGNDAAIHPCELIPAFPYRATIRNFEMRKNYEELPLSPKPKRSLARRALDLSKLKRRISLGINPPDTATYRPKLRKTKDEEKRASYTINQSEARVTTALLRSRSLIRDHRVAQENDYFAKSKGVIQESMDDCYVTLLPNRLSICARVPLHRKQNLEPNLKWNATNVYSHDDCYVTLQSGLAEACEPKPKALITKRCLIDRFENSSRHCKTTDNCDAITGPQTPSAPFGGKGSFETSFNSEERSSSKQNLYGFSEPTRLNALASPKLWGKSREVPMRRRQSDVVHARKLRCVSRMELDETIVAKEISRCVSDLKHVWRPDRGLR